MSQHSLKIVIQLPPDPLVSTLITKCIVKKSVVELISDKQKGRIDRVHYRYK